LYYSIKQFDFERYQIPLLNFDNKDSIVSCVQSDDMWEHVVRSGIVIPEVGTDKYIYNMGPPYYVRKVKLDWKVYPEFSKFVNKFRGEMEN